MIGDFSCAADSLGPWDVNYKGLLADEPMCCVFRPGAKANIVISLDIKTETEEGNAGGCWALFAKAFCFVVNQFEETYKKWKDSDQVLQVAGKSRPVNCNMNGNLFRLSSMWDRFAQDNLLFVGDVCVFELINNSTKLLQAEIFSAAKEANGFGAKVCKEIYYQNTVAMLPFEYRMEESGWLSAMFTTPVFILYDLL
ncbi:hypothetical protein DCAR_0414753 [Daucus carota subsp. sativus]|uniref:Uncharacterized protein n=1 Tax=Daucus carota subsp. sativus TaxID=79200 RepID=A0A164ZZY8_DAUCS|nr:hypothetical protein DCAR_0414753 [Daucus carota subsp. sativus]